MIVPAPTIEEYRKFAAVRVEALNYALQGIPEDRVRYHICWGSWHGPHTHDLPLKHVIDLMLKVKAGAYSLEAANPRHEHEWKVWKNVKLPQGKILIPGVVSHASNVVEHPELVADRIILLCRRGWTRERHRGHRLWRGSPRSPPRSPGRSSKRFPKEPRWRPNNFGAAPVRSLSDVEEFRVR
jgi:hypothetical protein